MYCVKNIKDDLFWVGGSDRRLALFENAYPIPNGISYNSYLLLDEKTVLFDTVDRAITGQFLENVESVLAGRTLDYVIVNHMEPDHCATLGELIRRYPDISVVCNAKTIPIIKQFYEFDIDTRAVIVKENDTFCSGRHTFTFLMAPMVHWPEVMVTYDTTDKILFSADAFGTFGAMNSISSVTGWQMPEDTIPTSSANTAHRFRRCLRRRPHWTSKSSARFMVPSGDPTSHGTWTSI